MMMKNAYDRNRSLAAKAANSEPRYQDGGTQLLPGLPYQSGFSPAPKASLK